MTRTATLCVIAVFAAGLTVLDAGPSWSLVERFQDKGVRMPGSYRARRHLAAGNRRFDSTGWMDVITELDGNRLTYAVVDRGGSSLVQNKVLLAALEGEKDLWAKGRDAFALSAANYAFEEIDEASGVPRLRLIPRRKDERLIDGWMRLSAEADVLEVSGRLARSPSFWTRSVMLSQRYASIGGVHLPISVTSVADVRFVGSSTFSMTYTYEVVNGVRVR